MTSGLKQKLDYGDLAHIPPDRLRYELSEGDLHVTPAPSPYHQWVSKQLQRQFEAYFEAPDLVVVTNRAQITTRAIEGPPALLVEVVSESTSSYDRSTKSRRYAALGVDHY